MVWVLLCTTLEGFRPLLVSDRIKKKGGGAEIPRRKKQDLLPEQENSPVNKEPLCLFQRSCRPGKGGLQQPTWHRTAVVHTHCNPPAVPWLSWRRGCDPKWSLTPINTSLINPLTSSFILHCVNSRYREGQATSSHLHPGPRKTRSRGPHLLEAGLLQPRLECCVVYICLLSMRQNSRQVFSFWLGSWFAFVAMRALPAILWCFPCPAPILTLVTVQGR